MYLLSFNLNLFLSAVRIECQLYAKSTFLIKIWRKVDTISFADIIVSLIRSKTIIGREKEKDLLERVYDSGKS